ncbi:MAG: hypothetical protein CVU89_09555 [Firmicutes bacterium HGW-Firmicutes-14]|nr:MAG: hypothetical protein CVU89_09555 [Firmicutes bacterium HGW-Firmicutes-14]
MRNKLRLIISVAVVLCFALSQVVFAAQVGLPETNIQNQAEITEDENVNETVYNDKNQRENAKFGLQVASEAIQLQKIGFETAKEALEEEKDQLEEAKDILEEEYEEAKEAGNFELADQLLEEIQATQEKINSIKQQIQETIGQIRELISNTYTAEEKQQLNQLADKLKATNKGLKVIPVDSVVVKGTIIKFDTPPVIKDGRTLVPVRAITEGFGADVKWDAVEKKVTITKGDKVIVLLIDSNVAYVNGVEVELDVKAELLNSRTIVPLRFIVENLGIKVNWDQATETIEIEAETEDETGETETNNE